MDQLDRARITLALSIFALVVSIGALMFVVM